MSASQEAAADVSPIENALALLVAKVSQAERAAAVGLRCHTQISKRDARVVTGEAEGYLEAYPALYLVRLAKRYPSLGDSLVRWLASEVDQVADAQSVERDLTAVAMAAAGEIQVILQDIGGGIDREEAARHSEALAHLQDQIHRARINLDKRARGVRRSA